MQNFEQFKADVMEQVFDYLPAEYSNGKAEVTTVKKATGNYEGLIIRLPDNVVNATANLTEFYNDLGKFSFEEIMERIAKVLQMKPHDNFSEARAMITDYSRAKERLFIRLVSANNADFLENVPNKVVAGDLAIVPYILVNQDSKGLATAAVNRDLASHYGVSDEELLNEAMENAPKIMPVKIKTLLGVVAELAGEENSGEDSEVSNEPLVVTNSSGQCGAAAIFYPEVMEQLAEKFGGKFCVIPSSIHEVLIVPDNGDHETLNNMVRSVNEDILNPGEFLSDHIYLCDGNEIRS